MTERGLPIVGGAPACPFVAFVDDRDERATSPDHRHRCYAEAEPAPRALAHQEAYCLSSAFPVCPTFQDWARREAAKARPGQAPIDDGEEDADVAPLVEDRPPRRSGHSWSAPPPWLSGQQGRPGGGMDRPAADAPAPGRAPASGSGGTGAPGAGAGAAGLAAGGLAGSFADRLASHAGEPVTEPEPEWDDDEPWDDDDAAGRSAPAAAAPSASQSVMPRRREHERVEAGREPDDRERDVYAPSWERPRRLEAYPTLRSRRLSAMVLPPLLLALVAVLLAAAALFVGPSLLGMFGGPGGSPTPAPSATPGPSVSAGPTIAPAATPQLYTVQAGDTMSKIANRFHVPLATLIEANRATVPNPDKLAVGDVLVIPTATPSELPGASTTP